ncbi:MAG: hypothetical protein JW717_04560 [Marinilabiliaceae bacterium]|nr:hypothetical protein [Marinilabiliaceae bacterium]
MTKLYKTLFLFISLLPAFTNAQRLVEIIEQTEKAALTVLCQTKNGNILTEGSGFFISADGIAIIPAHLFFLSDSVTLKTRNGKKFAVEKILQSNPKANLVIVKSNAPKLKEYNYLIPSKQFIKENQELLIFGHPNDMDDGMAIVSAKEIKYQLFIKRIALLNNNMSQKSFGAPIVNNRGELIGIINSYTSNTSPLALSTTIINDSNWININLPPQLINTNPKIKNQLFQGYNEGLFYLTNELYENAAKSFSNYINLVKDNAELYALRGHSRFMYQNSYGCKEDFQMCKQLNPDCFLPYYFNGLHSLSNLRKEDALVNFSICIEKNPKFPNALVEHGKLQIELNKNLEVAYLNFQKAIEVDSTYGAGFYEKARFTLQYIENKNTAEPDIDKAIELSPNLPGIYSIRGMMKINGENYLAAIKDLETALKKNPKDTYAIFNLGIAQYNLGMKDKACKEWEKAGNLGHYKSIKYSSRYCTGSNRKY